MTDAVQDQLAIQRVKADYTYGCDNPDWDLLASVFSEDATIDFSATGGPAGPRDEMVTWLRETLGGMHRVHHIVSGFQIDVDGDRASVRSQFHCTILLTPEPPAIVTGGYYEEEYVRTAAGWKIARLYEDSRWLLGR
jgi:ketosteroid isomerase-like protein